jgi:anion-transporting  ArsA/GET3 family ATPase
VSSPEKRAIGRTSLDGGLARQLGDLEVVICCGSGGVGKTTVSAALAAAIAREDKRVLVLTIDPAKRLATSMGLEKLGSDPVVIPATRLRRAGLDLRGNLSAAMLDQKSAWDRMVERYAPDRKTAQRILRNRFYQGISEAFVGSHEFMAMESLYELHNAREYDVVVIDTPPSRNALDFLEAPDRLADFVGAKLLSWLARPSRFGFRAVGLAASPFLRLADKLLGGDVLAEVSDFVTDLQSLYGGIQAHAREVSKLLRSPRVGFVVVTTLEPAPFEEAEFFVAKLRQFKMPLRAVVVNRVYPDWLRDDATYRAAELMAEEAVAVTRLGRVVGQEIDGAAAAHVGRNYRFLAELARRDAKQLGRLGRLTNVGTVRVPLLVGAVSDLEALAHVAEAF